MNITLKVSAVLTNPPGIWEDEMPCELPDLTYVRTAITKIIHGILGGGGLFREISETETEFIPLLRVQNINVKANVVAVADNFDLAQATTRAKGLITA